MSTSRYYQAHSNTETERALAEAVAKSNDVLEIEVTVKVSIPMRHLFDNPTEGLDNIAWMNKHALEAAICEVVRQDRAEQIVTMEAYWGLWQVVYDALAEAKPEDEELLRSLYKRMKELAKKAGFEHTDTSVAKAFAQKGVNLE